MDTMDNLREIPIEGRKCLANQILVDVTRFMEKHNLKYWLAYGTLLGAVRHGGYIPWDDDIDLCMPRKDYFEFIELWNKYTDEHSDIYEIITPHKIEGSIYKRLKIVDNRTIMKEYTQIKSAVFIDVFPVDGYKNEADFEKGLREVHRLQNLYDLLSHQTIAYSNPFKQVMGHMILFFYKLTGRERKLEKIKNKLLTKYDFYSLNYCSYAEDAYIKKGPWKTEWMEPLKKISFENNEYLCPCDYDAVLTKSYGDYMTLPPEDKRYAHGWYNMYWREEVTDEEIKEAISGWVSCAK